MRENRIMLHFTKSKNRSLELNSLLILIHEYFVHLMRLQVSASIQSKLDTKFNHILSNCKPNY